VEKVLTTKPWDRRTFLRRVGAAGLGAPVIALYACSDQSQPEAEASIASVGRTIVDPILRSYPVDAARIVSPMSEPPLAYVSQGLRLVFVDREYRDLIVGILSAHISVSTGHWRIPQPGDRPEEPLIPGVPLREFEPVGIGDLDLEMEPAEGDFRVRRGQRARTTIDFSCVPMVDSSRRISGGPWHIEQCDGSGAGTCREDFVELGSGFRFSDGNCQDGVGEIRLLAWVCPQA
jgi:hypothetical protein